MLMDSLLCFNHTAEVPTTPGEVPCIDNAMAESLFAVLECEFVNRRSFRDPDDARGAVLEFIDGWYTPRRR